MNSAIPTLTVHDLDALSVSSLMKVETYIEEAAAKTAWPGEDDIPLFAQEVSRQLNCAPTHDKVTNHLLGIIRGRYRVALQGRQLCDYPHSEKYLFAADGDAPSYLEDHLPG